MKTKTKKIVSSISIFALLLANMTPVFAVETVGEITISNTAGNPITDTANINWDENFEGTNNATGSISGIKVIATVKPVIDMRISNSLIDLGNISGVTGSGILNIEVGTNSPSGVVVNAISQNGGLKHSTENTKINNTNGGAYTFASANASGAVGSPTFTSSPVDVINENQSVQIYSNNQVENLETSTYDIEFKVAALAQSSATAGNYEDYITFSIIANF